MLAFDLVNYINLNSLNSFLRDSTMKMIPTRAAKASSVNLVKYRTMADRSRATMMRQNKVDQSPIQSLMVR